MSRRSFHRSLTALLMVVSLLFSQLALSAYVCPGMTDTTTMAEMMAAGEPCEGMDTAQPVLCHQYGMNAPQSAELPKVPAPSLPAIVQMLVVPAFADVLESAALSVTAAPEARPPPDPVFLSTLRLRV